MSQENKTNWTKRAEGGYQSLGWVNAQGLLDHIVSVAELNGTESVVDIGTGSQAVLNTILPHLDKGGKAFGFDLNFEMLGNSSQEKRNHLFLADAKNIPLPDSSVDVVTARMVFHHIPSNDLPAVISESTRILKPEGKLIVCEYVTPDEEVWEFERGVFDIKEPERNLWTSEQYYSLISSCVDNHIPSQTTKLSFMILPKYSVKDWMGKSGLPKYTQDKVLSMYLNASGNIQEKMGIEYTADGDALVDRLFGYTLSSSS